MAIIDLKKAVITISDGTAVTPLSITAKIGDGNLTFTEKRNIEYKKDRGLLDTAREGDQEPVDVKMDAQWIFLKGDSGDTGYTTSLHDAIKGVGSASTWVTSATDTCAPYAVDIAIVYTPCAGKIETIVLSDFRWESMDYDPKAGTISVSGKCNVVAATSTRTTPP